MNISGFQYSAATKGLRQKDKINDQQFKLVFVYPILYDKSLTKIVDTIRDFISVSMLREIFTSNSLNMIHMASQIHPLMDERGNSVNQGAIISHAKIQSSINDAQIQNYQPSFTNDQLKHELRQKIQSKTATIKSYLNNDPRLKAFRPYVEMITMNNMIDVPVILGTKGFDIDTATMTFIILIAISQQLSLSNSQDLAELFRLLRQTKPEDSWKLLNNILISKPDKTQSRLSQWFEQKWNIVRNSTDSALMGSPVGPYYDKAKDVYKDTKKTISSFIPRKNNGVKKEYRDIPLQQTFALMKSVQTEADKAELNFKMVTDPSLLKTKFGLTLQNGQTQNAINNKKDSSSVRIDIKLQNVFEQLYIGFMNDINQYAISIYNSYINLFYPKNDVSQVIDPLKVFNDILDKNIVGPIHEFISEVLITDVNSSLSSLTPSQSEQKIKALKGLCKDLVPSVNNTFDNILDKMDYDIDGVDFRSDDVKRFITSMNSMSKASSSQLSSIQMGLSKVLNMPSIANRLKFISNSIIKSFDAIDNELKTHNLQTIAIMATPDTGIDDSIKLQKFREQVKHACAPIIEFLFWRNVIVALCNYSSIVETSIETASSDVMDELNYTLILPLETLMAVAHAFEAKSYRNMMNNFKWGEENPNDNNFKDMRGGGNASHLNKLFGPLNDNYIKGVIKFIVKKLDVPNVIVVDSKANKIYYRLMYMTEIYQSSFSTLQTFIELTTKQTLQDNSSYGAW